MIKIVNGKQKKMTNAEIAEYNILPDAHIPDTAGDTGALHEFISGLASSETNSIAKIRELAKQFLNKQA